MNLVKAQALANDLPPQELKKYADGFDPRVIPPWIATGTLQAKMDLQKRMQNMTGAAQGEQPSIKEQIEQKAGLMAANNMQQQQQQQQQQMAMASRPGPAPEGVPQPEDQPEAPFMAARGGLASVPVRFAFKPGGLVAFSNGGESRVSPEFETAPSAEQVMSDEERRREAISNMSREERLRYFGTDDVELAVRGGAFAKQPAQQAPSPRPASVPASVSEARATAMAGPQAAVAPPPRPQMAPPRPAAPPARATSGLPAAASRSPYFAQADAALNEPNVRPTPESIIAEQKALSPQAMQEDMMRQRYEERKARADRERATFERTRPSGLDDLIRVYGQAGQYKGGTGIGPAYTANQQQKRAEEMALEKRMNELYTAADTQEYEGAKEIYSARAGAMKEANRSYQDRLKSKAETLAQLANVDEKRIQSELDRLNQMEVAKLRAADAGSGDMKYLAQYLALKSAGKDKEAAALLESFSLFKRGEPKADPYSKDLMQEIAKKEVALAAMPPSKLADETRAQLAALKRQAGIGGGGQASQTGKVVDFNSLPK